MQTIEQKIQIRQWPVRALFNYVSDITNNATWQGDVANAEWLDMRRNCFGAKFQEIRRDVDIEHVTVCEIAEFVPDCRRTIVVADEPFVSTHIMEFEQHEDFSIMKLTVHIDHCNTALASEAANRFLERSMIDLARLKNVLESEV